ncbi:MAG: type II toxin-antitoxin system HicA family toxin [Candidatus Hydrogenedentota bacterium]
MSKYAKLRLKILAGTSDANIRFSELCQLLERLGFEERVKGDHHIFTRENAGEIINLQPKAGMAKAYQVRQVRALLIKYKLGAQGVD